ncbi:hypothetical protein TYRP_018486 [Tyrophagus putrescentiae]|nr:hypothetical protein TYRP_018486 [Tyrophagus putrescentiae]
MKINRRNIQKFYADSIEKIVSPLADTDQSRRRPHVVVVVVVVVSDRCLPVDWLCSGNIGQTLARFKTALLGDGFHLTSARLLDHHLISSILGDFSDKSLWRSQTVPIITAINFLLTRGRLPGGATDLRMA